MPAASLPARAASARPARSRRVLALAGDERLVEQIRRGSEAAFEVAFERHGPAILAFCRHMLGSVEEAEDAVQHTFAAAYRDLQHDGERAIALKPWLFAIARNRCLSVLRARREQPLEDHELPTAGLTEQVEQRAELRQLLADLRELPEEQRAALLLAELGDLSHVEVGDVLGCEVGRVKALVYRARSGLIARREAREIPCELIREQLSNLRGGSLRRSELRLHLRECPGCQAFREQVKRQRAMLAVALPVAPGMGLKASVLAAVGLGGGSAGGGAAAAVVAKLAVAGALAGGGVVAVSDRGPAVPVPSGVNGGGVGVEGSSAAPAQRHSPVSAPGGVTSYPRISGESRHTPPPRPASETKRGRDREPPRAANPKPRPQRGRARGPVEAPPAETPVRRRPPEPKPPKAKPAPEPQLKPKSPPAPPAHAAPQAQTRPAPRSEAKAPPKPKQAPVTPAPEAAPQVKAPAPKAKPDKAR